MNPHLEPLKISLDELRMQMLGAQVLFGFQFQALFQPHFQPLSVTERIAAACGLLFAVSTIALLVTAPCIHRLSERGRANQRMRVFATRLATLALTTTALTLACAIYLVTHKHFGAGLASATAAVALLCCTTLWWWLGIWMRLNSRAEATQSRPTGQLEYMDRRRD
jgi:hypothetical protein